MTGLLRRVIWRFRAITVPRPRILVYHRVARAPQPDTSGMYVSPEDFGEHLGLLRTRYHPMPMAQFLRRWRQGELPHNAVVVTFDDGYADNLTHALPILERFDVPGTFFVTSGYVGGRGEFWWDALERLLQPTTGMHARIRATLGLPSAPTDDPATFRACRGRLLALTVERRDALLADWNTAAGFRDPCRETHRVLDEEQLVALAKHPLVEIGAHSVSHPFLPSLCVADQVDEVVRSRTMLEAQTGGPVPYFAYPFGAGDDSSESAVQRAGFDCAFTTEWAPVVRGASRWRLPRLMMSGEVERLARALARTA